MRRRTAPSAKGATHRTATKQPGQHLDPIARHDRHAISEPVGETGVVDVDDLEPVTPAPGVPLHRGKRRGTDRARSPGVEDDVAHRDIVLPMRPATTLAIVVLLIILGVAAISFVIRLLSVT